MFEFVIQNIINDIEKRNYGVASRTSAFYINNMFYYHALRHARYISICIYFEAILYILYLSNKILMTLYY